MANPESISHKPVVSTKESLTHTQEGERRREYHFRAFVQSHLLNTLQNTLSEANFSPEEEDEFLSTLSALTETDQKSVLTLPFEIRGQLLSRYHDRIKNGLMMPADVVRDLLQKNKRYGYTLGYHLSNHQIPKKQAAWDVAGNELDDRDNMKMAYYSEDYLNRYKKKSGHWLYVVRAETGPESSHKVDLKNHWGRAPTLSIVDELDMRQVEQAIEEALEKENAAAK